MKKKKISKLFLGLLIAIIFYFIVFFPINVLPKIVSLILDFFNISQNHFSMIKSLVLAIILFIFTSDIAYKHIIKWCSEKIQNTSKPHKQIFYYCLISAIDTWTAFPKRTVLFTIYLFLSILDKFGYITEDTDYIFISVFIIGIDRIIKHWKDEKKKLYAFGKKAYSDTSNITDEIL